MVNIRIDFGRIFHFFRFFPYKFNPLNQKKTRIQRYVFFSRKKGRKSLSEIDNQVVNLFGIDWGRIFVFTSGLQIDLWTELRVKKWSKDAFLGV